MQFFILNSKLFKYVYLYFGEPNKIIDDQESLDGTSIFSLLFMIIICGGKLILNLLTIQAAVHCYHDYENDGFFFGLYQSPPLIL